MSERPWDPATYDQAWARMAAAGQDPHGEASFVSRSLVRLGLRGTGPGGAPNVLDAGCGTGRVAIELERRGMSVTGTDVDPTMLEAARSKAPHLRWIEADLSTLELVERFATWDEDAWDPGADYAVSVHRLGIG